MTITPELSVVIPAYNAAETLDAQLRALTTQENAAPFEVLVCDNGSTDRTADVVRAWQQELPQLRLIDASDRRGPSAARNIGAEQARAPFLAFCDADDIVAADWLATLHDSLQHAPLVAGRLDAVPLNRENRASVTWNPDGTIIEGFWPQYEAAASSNLGVSAAAFREVGGFDERLKTGEDVDLCWRIQLAGYPLARSGATVQLRKRDGLRAVYRQAYSYRVGTRQLRFKYALLAEAYRAPAPNSPRSAGARASPTRLGRLIGRALAVRRAGDFADAAWRLGEWAGERFGRVDQTMPQIRPPDAHPTSPGK